MDVEGVLAGIQAARSQWGHAYPSVLRPFEGDLERVALPARDALALRDCLITEGAQTVIEVGLAYGSSALAIGEALIRTCGKGARHVAIDPFQATSFANAGWDLLVSMGLEATTRLILEPSSLALPKLLEEGFVADAAFVDGSHRFHEVFVDLYFLRKLVRPGGLIVLDDAQWPSVASALDYFDKNLEWESVELDSRLVARRLPMEVREPSFEDFVPFN